MRTDAPSDSVSTVHTPAAMGEQDCNPKCSTLHRFRLPDQPCASRSSISRAPSQSPTLTVESTLSAAGAVAPGSDNLGLEMAVPATGAGDAATGAGEPATSGQKRLLWLQATPHMQGLRQQVRGTLGSAISERLP